MFSLYSLIFHIPRQEDILSKKLPPSESRDSLPLWKNWADASRQCQDKKMASGVPWSQEHLDKLKDARTYTAFATKHIFGDWVQREREMTEDVLHSVMSPRQKYRRKEYRDSCREVGHCVT